MLISVIMSVYNTEDYLKEAIDSILGQTYKKFEFIIIDDGSVDSSPNIIRKYAAIDDRIVFIQNESNIGLPRSLNKGIQLAKGEYIARQDADDISALTRLETQLNYALQHTEVDMIGSDCYVIDIAGNVVCENDNYSKIVDYKKSLLNRKAIFPHGTALIKRDKIIQAGLYDPRFYYSQDGELWLRLINKGARVHTIDSPLYYYRVVPNTNNKKDNAQQSYNKVKQMIYAENCDESIINGELLKIHNAIRDKHAVKIIPNHMATYWKSLANTAYFNKSLNKATPYKYLYKAFKENQSFGDYFHYLKLGLIYFIPTPIIKKLTS